MSDEPVPANGDMNKLQQDHDQLMNALGLPRLDVHTMAPVGKLTLRERLRFSRWWIPSAAMLRWIVLAAVFVGALLYVGYGLGRVAAPSAGTRPAVGVAGGLPVVSDASVFTAPPSDSLRQTILSGTSSMVLAPGSSLTISKMIMTEAQVPKFEARLTGSAHFDLRGPVQLLYIRSPSGWAGLNAPGRYDVTGTADALVARTHDGFILMKASGFFAALGRRIYPGLEGRAVHGHMVQVKRFAP